MKVIWSWNLRNTNGMARGAENKLSRNSVQLLHHRPRLSNSSHPVLRCQGSTPSLGAALAITHKDIAAGPVCSVNSETLSGIKQHDVLEMVDGSGRTEYATALTTYDPHAQVLEVAWKGARLLILLEHGSCVGYKIGLHPDPSSDLVKSLPGWQSSLSVIQARSAVQHRIAKPPSPPSSSPPPPPPPPSSSSSSSSSAAASNPPPAPSSSQGDTPLLTTQSPSSLPLRPPHPANEASTTGTGTAAAQPLVISGLSVMSSLTELTQRVAADPRPWCDGTGPGDPPPSPADVALQTAAELAALLGGYRGVVLLQLAATWDDQVPQPVFRPLVVEMLTQAVSSPQLSIFISKTPGDLGVTAVLACRAQPWRSWAAHLASFGCQAALVAGSPYYKMLVGRVLGYKEENVIHHIRSVDGPQQPTKEVVAAVSDALLKLSEVPPRLPWTKFITASDMAAPVTKSVAPPRGSRRKADKQTGDIKGFKAAKGKSK